MPIFEYECGNCELVWEDTILAGEEEPKVCPGCNEEEIRKLISLPATGKVRLYGHEYKQHIKEETGKLQKQMMKDENLLANFIGENKYEKQTKQYEKDKAGRPKIKASNKK